MSDTSLPITVVIPTYHRGASAVRTISEVLAQRPGEVLLIDQTEQQYPVDIEDRLAQFERAFPLRRISLSPPSIPAALNAGLLESRSDVVLFLDDDATPGEGLLARHLESFEAPGPAAVAGRVIQPQPRAPNRPSELIEDLDFDFTSGEPRQVKNVMAGNLSVLRSAALEVGGFDENFVGAAYRFETDFARRLTDAGHVILYRPEAYIHHRREPYGGTRALGDHRRSISPAHSVGDYYFARRHVGRAWFARYVLIRLRRNVLTRYHLRHPWWIPAKAIGELRGLLMSKKLARQGPKLLVAS